MRILIAIFFVLAKLLATAQSDSSQSKLTFSGYLETYFSYDSRNPDNHIKPNFIYSHNRSNEININLAYLKATYEKQNIRSNLAFMTGTYSNANLASEPGVLKNIYEANIGVKISKKKELWIDAGIFPSHIGFESAHTPSCWTLTRSILADNSPYYESGVKISFTTNNKKWLLSGLLLNGWQHIVRPNGNNALALGHQVTYKPNDKIALNSSSFIGSDTPDSDRRMRYFHNFYGQFQVHKNVGIIFGFDNGLQQKSKHSTDYSMWYSPVLITKINTSKKTSISLRGEYYSDVDQVIVSTNSSYAFETIGYSANFDYLINDNALWRIEAKGLTSSENIYIQKSGATNNIYFITTSLMVNF